MRRNCPHCGVEYQVAEDQLSSGVALARCHDCSRISIVRARSAETRPQLPPVPDFLRREKRREPVEPVMSANSEVSAAQPPSFPPPAVVAAPALEKPIQEIQAVQKTLQEERALNQEIAATLRQLNQLESTVSQAAIPSVPTPPPFLSGAPVFQAATPSQNANRNPAPDAPSSDSLKGDSLVGDSLAGDLNSPARHSAAPVSRKVVQHAAILCVFTASVFALRWSLSPVLSPSHSATSAEDSASRQEEVANSSLPRRLRAQQVDAIQTAQSSSAPVAPHAAPQVAAAAPVVAPKVEDHKVEEHKVLVTAPVAILRSGPGTQFRKVGNAMASTEFKVKGADRSWILVESAFGGTAWIRSDLVRPLLATAPTTQGGK